SLQNGITESLGLTELPAGHYTQIRLKLGDTVEDGLADPPPYPNCVYTGTAYEILTIPSGFQSGLKLIHPFDIQGGFTYELLLDFDASESIHQTGAGDYIMRPTIRVIEIDLTGSVSGQADAGAIVMAQQAVLEACGGIRIAQTTTADPDGLYTLGYLEPGEYNLVVVLDGYMIAVEAGILS
ncbi:MAG: DUF4382 domain-containing protein, partial [Deltaproteobacteria bacterium]|nr:DUF4382 domain-containing protein [Deltaproteobacteria bacterium]